MIHALSITEANLLHPNPHVWYSLVATITIPTIATVDCSRVAHTGTPLSSPAYQNTVTATPPPPPITTTILVVCIYLFINCSLVRHPTSGYHTTHGRLCALSLCSSHRPHTNNKQVNCRPNQKQNKSKNMVSRLYAKNFVYCPF